MSTEHGSQPHEMLAPAASAIGAPETTAQEHFLDSAEFREYEQFGGTQEVYELLSPDVAELATHLKDLENGISPMLSFPKLDLAVIQRNIAGLQGLQTKVALITNPIVKNAYQKQLPAKIAEWKMAEAAAHGDNLGVSEGSKQVYGDMSQPHFAFALVKEHEQIDQHLKSDNPQIKESAQTIKNLFPKKPNAKNIAIPDEAALDALKKQTEHKLNALDQTVQEEKTEANAQAAQDVDDVMHGRNPDREFNAQEIKGISEELLKVMGAVKQGWKVVITDEKKSTINVSQEKKEVQIPAMKTAKTDLVRGLMAHEILTHVGRRVEGEKTGLLILSSGLNGQEPAEEGLATLRERLVRGLPPVDFGRVDHYLTIGLKMGLDGTKRTAAEVYKIMKAFYAYKKAINDKDYEAVNKLEPKTAAIQYLARALRGIKDPGQKDGAVFLKDKIYFEGRIRAANAIAKKPAVLPFIDRGKWNFEDEGQFELQQNLPEKKAA